MTGRILAPVRSALAARAAAATAPRVTVGERVVMVEVTHPDHGRLAGLAHRPDGSPGDGDDGTEDARAGRTGGDSFGHEGRGCGISELPDGDVAGLAARATMGTTPLDRAVGVGTLNALSVPDVDWRSGDPMAWLSPAVDVVATVGLFRPAFRKFDDVTVRVVERDPPRSVPAPPGVTVTTHARGDCDGAFADADVCFLTGSTLVYGGVKRYLDALADRDVSPVVLVGATASHRPGPAFDAGVDVVAGARVTDPARVREQVRAGDCGTDLHDGGVEKVYVPGPGTSGPALEGPRPGSRIRGDRATEPQQ